MRLIQTYPVWDWQTGEYLVGREEFPLLFEAAKLISLLTPYTFLPSGYAHEVCLSLDKRFGHVFDIIQGSDLLEVAIANVFQHRSQLG